MYCIEVIFARFYFHYEAKTLKLILLHYKLYMKYRQNVKIKTCEIFISEYF